MTRIVRVKNNKGSDDTWVGQLIADGTYYDLLETDITFWSNDDKVFADVTNGNLIVNRGSDTVDDILNSLAGWNWLVGNPETDVDGFPIVSLGNNKTLYDGRNVVSVNRMPAGYNVTWTSRGDDIDNGTYLNGTQIELTSLTPNNTLEMQFLDPFYVIGGRITWFGAKYGDYINVYMIAPATTGLTQQAGDFNKVEIVPSSGLNIIVPASPGTGAWDMDLSATLNANVNILKATPIPNSSETGWFNYDTETNVLTPNYTGTGKYDLFDFEITLLRYVTEYYPILGDSFRNFELENVVAKFILPNYVFRFKTNSILVGTSCRVEATIGRNYTG